MKKFYVIYVFLAFVLLQSCDKIDGPYTSPVPAKDWYGKRILIEDYTGHTCPNCPSAAITAANIKSLYGDKIIILSVHAGFFAKLSAPPFDTNDFRTSAGEEWDQFFGNSSAGNPNGMINRVGYSVISPANVVYPDAWAAKVGSMMTEIPEVEIEITPSFNAATKILTGQVKTTFLKTIKKHLKLQIVMSEDSIVAPQKNLSITVVDYVHRHVMRGAINGNWGSTLTDGQTNTPIDTQLSQNMLFTLDLKWNSKHCNVIAFVYDAETYEILQVSEKHIE